MGGGPLSPNGSRGGRPVGTRTRNNGGESVSSATVRAGDKDARHTHTHTRIRNHRDDGTVITRGTAASLPGTSWANKASEARSSTAHHRQALGKEEGGGSHFRHIRAAKMIGRQTRKLKTGKPELNARICCTLGGPARAALQ